MSSPAEPADGSLERYRAYLQFLARLRLGRWLQGQLSASDVVQETLLKAHKHRDQFRGQTEAEYRGYLRRILANTVADAARKLPDVLPARYPPPRQALARRDFSAAGAKGPLSRTGESEPTS